MNSLRAGIDQFRGNTTERILKTTAAIGITLGFVACGAEAIEVPISELAAQGCDLEDQNNYEITGNVQSVQHESDSELKFVYDVFDGDLEPAIVETHTYDMTIADNSNPDSTLRVVYVDDGGFVTAFPGPIKPNGKTDFDNEAVDFTVSPEEYEGECVFVAQ